MDLPRFEVLQYAFSVYPATVPANMSATGSFAYLACKDVTRKLMQQKSELQTNDKIQGQVEYPHNLLRNIAKESALTEYVLGMFYLKFPL